MAKVIKGVVKYIADEKRYENYGLKLVDREEWFNTPNRVKGILERGNEVKLVVEENERGGFNVVKKPELIKKGTLPKGGGKFGGKGRQFKEDPEKASRIAAEASQKVAVEALAMIVAQGGLKLPAKKPDAIKTVLLETMDELTAKFYRQVYDPKLFLSKEEETEEDLGETEESEESEEESEEEEESSEEETEEEGIEDDVPWDKE